LQGLKQLWFRGEDSPKKPTSGGQMRPWERVGMSRSTWFRKGKPAKLSPRRTQVQLASELKISVRTLQRRALTGR
jgi:hypothetical protein